MRRYTNTFNHGCLYVTESTDHYELSPTLDITLENSPVKPEEVLADAGYNTETIFKYLNQEEIE